MASVTSKRTDSVDQIVVFRDGFDYVTARKRLTDSGGTRMYEGKRWETADLVDLVTYLGITLEDFHRNIQKLPTLPSDFWNTLCRSMPNAA